MNGLASIHPIEPDDQPWADSQLDKVLGALFKQHRLTLCSVRSVLLCSDLLCAARCSCSHDRPTCTFGTTGEHSSFVPPDLDAAYDTRPDRQSTSIISTLSSPFFQHILVLAFSLVALTSSSSLIPLPRLVALPSTRERVCALTNVPDRLTERTSCNLIRRYPPIATTRARAHHTHYIVHNTHNLTALHCTAQAQKRVTGQRTTLEGSTYLLGLCQKAIGAAKVDLLRRCPLLPSFSLLPRPACRFARHPTPDTRARARARASAHTS